LRRLACWNRGFEQVAFGEPSGIEIGAERLMVSGERRIVCLRVFWFFLVGSVFVFLFSISSNSGKKLVVYKRKVCINMSISVG
jgi:hypothetical protein